MDFDWLDNMFFSESNPVIPLDLREVNLTSMDLTGDLTTLMKENRDRERLALSNLQIKEFPKIKQGIDEFKSLYLENCQIISFENFEKVFSNLTEMKIVNCKLKEIPDCFQKLKNLKVVDFTGNEIKIIPQFIQKMSSIEQFSVGGNQIKKLENLNWKHISILNLENNKLHGYPKQSISNSILSLNLSNNIIGFIANDIKYIPSIQNLILNNCGLEIFPTPILSLKNLKVLDLSNNRLLNIHSFEKEENNYLQQLEELKMDNCNLKKKIRISFKNLKKLSLRNNELTHFPFWVPNSICKISEIDVSNNLIQNVSKISFFSNLKNLILKNNKIEDLEETFSSLTQLTYVDASYNLIGQLPSISSKQIVSLILCRNRINEIETFDGLEVLKNLDLSYNKIKKLPNCSSLKSLKFLDLSNNELENIEESLYFCNQISSLNLSSNFIQELSKHIQNLNNLKIFDCQVNDIQNLPLEIIKLENLTKFKATFNPCCLTVDQKITTWFHNKRNLTYNLKFPEIINFWEGLYVGHFCYLRSKSHLEKLGVTDVISIDIPNVSNNVKELFF